MLTVGFLWLRISANSPLTPVCPMSSHEANPFLANYIITRKHMHRYALCSRIISTTNISRPTSDTVLAQRLPFGLLDIFAALHAHLGFTRSSEMYTTSDVTTLFWPRQDGRQFWSRLAEFKGLNESFPRPVGQKKLHCACK